MKTKHKNTPKKSQDKTSTQFPGYPLYAAADDITARAQRVESGESVQQGTPYTPAIDSDEDEKELSSPKSENPSSLTKEDWEALGDDNLESDDGEDEGLKNRVTEVDFSGEDLDVPGADDSEDGKEIEDEENKNFSLGGDDHNDLEEDRS